MILAKQSKNSVSFLGYRTIVDGEHNASSLSTESMRVWMASSGMVLLSRSTDYHSSSAEGDGDMACKGRPITFQTSSIGEISGRMAARVAFTHLSENVG
ncbi:hypothetical protein TNCV_1318721 [Trichonephila clavipes]|nr:hypothetical protein TNCV_1318721 [Trichonephila clavipes]